MSNETSTTTSNDHYQAIHEILECLVTSDGSVYRITDAQADQVESHAAAMAQQLADVQEVCRNLSEAEREYEAEHAAMAAQIEEHNRWWQWVLREAEDVCVIVDNRQMDLRSLLENFDTPAPDLPTIEEASE